MAFLVLTILQTISPLNFPEKISKLCSTVLYFLIENKIKKTEGNRSKNTPYGVLVSRQFWSFEKKILEVAGRLRPDHAACTKRICVSARVHKNKSMQHHTLGSGTAKFQVT